MGSSKVATHLGCPNFVQCFPLMQRAGCSCHTTRGPVFPREQESQPIQAKGKHVSLLSPALTPGGFCSPFTDQSMTDIP